MLDVFKCRHRIETELLGDNNVLNVAVENLQKILLIEMLHTKQVHFFKHGFDKFIAGVPSLLCLH